MLARIKFELDELVNEMLDHLPNSIWESETTTFLDPSMGGGQFVKEIERRLRNAGHSDKNISKRVFGYESIQMRINYAIRKHGLIGIYKSGNVLDMEFDMKFDVIVGNPPFNESSKSENTIAGTSGNTILYRKFIDCAFRIRVPSGSVAFVVQRSGIRYAINKFSVTKIDLDTSDVWDFTAGYFISVGNDNSVRDVTADTILPKVYSLKTVRQFTAAKSGSFEKYLNDGLYTNTQNDGGVYGIVNTPSAIEPARYMYINGTTIKAGPKLVFKGLESINSYIVTDLPVHVGSACTFGFDSMEDAEKAQRFIINNKALKYLKRKLNEKTLGYVFRFCKEFDWSQIETGFEYPVEWNLSQKEIALIEKTVG